ncbi:MAG: hypothetical protein PHQ98_03455 [Candidatus ainarchaeum sp.]|nr:hypothetical protein [Candidatus ainarchaeum sp.]
MISKCPVCNSRRIVSRDGKIIKCQKCGFKHYARKISYLLNNYS